MKKLSKIPYYFSRAWSLLKQEGPLSFSRAVVSAIKRRVFPKRYIYFMPTYPVDFNVWLSGLKAPQQFSIVVPVYNTAPDLLFKMISSVKAQWYPHWELILVDDASSSVKTKQALQKINDPKISVITLEHNQGIAGATNVGLNKAKGDFIVFLDHDDELTLDCLYELACCIERDLPDYIYSDEDKLTMKGRFLEPHFKPDWSPDALMSIMYTSHVSCVRTSLVKEVGLLNSEFDGSQDWDFVLRLTEKTTRISHIPKVLYHWRMAPGSAAREVQAKLYALDASCRVREAALKRRNLAGHLEPLADPGYARVNYFLQGSPLISIIIPSRDNVKVLAPCIESILQKSSYRQFEIIIIDNGSVDPSTLAYLEKIKEKERILVIRDDSPFNFSSLNNLAVKHSRGELLLFLNDDTEVLTPDWLERMGGYAQLPHVGAVGAKLLYPGPNQLQQHAGVLSLKPGPAHAFVFLDHKAPGYFYRNLLEYNWIAVTGACLMVGRDKFLSVGGFEETLPVAYNDVELCFKFCRTGLYNVVCQAVELLHYESVSRGFDGQDEKKMLRLSRDFKRLYELHPYYLGYDPFFNPNLDPSGQRFELC